MYNCCTFDNFLSSVSIPKQDFVGQNVLMRQSSASMHAVSLSTFAVPQFSADDTADHCLSVDARLSTFYGNTSNPTHPIVSYPMIQASDSQSNYHKYENKLAVSSGGRVLETRGEDKGGVSNHGHRLQLKTAPALTYCSNLNKRKIDLPVEASKIKRCRGSTKQNHKDEADNANEISKPDFIHVRARRGQATDSHSLAERARREKINERMRVLRDLVPGCYKATGKVVKQLDEIINYVQSLQNQVEILSMKLSAASRQYDSSVEVEKEPPPSGECGKTSVVPITFCEDAAPLNYSVTRSESPDRTYDSLIMGTTFADDVASGFGLMDANQWNVDLQGGFQDQHRIL